MRTLILSLLLIFNYSLYSQKIVVFSKTENCNFTGELKSCNPENPEKREFLRNFAGMANTYPANLAKARLTTPPLEWGKKVSDSTYGEISYSLTFKFGFYVDLKLQNLLPDHIYSLCLNGNPKLAGNERCAWQNWLGRSNC